MSFTLHLRQDVPGEEKATVECVTLTQDGSECTVFFGLGNGLIGKSRFSVGEKTGFLSLLPPFAEKEDISQDAGDAEAFTVISVNGDTIEADYATIPSTLDGDEPSTVSDQRPDDPASEATLTATKGKLLSGSTTQACSSADGKRINATPPASPTKSAPTRTPTATTSRPTTPSKQDNPLNASMSSATSISGAWAWDDDTIGERVYCPDSVLRITTGRVEDMLACTTQQCVLVSDSKSCLHAIDYDFRYSAHVARFPYTKRIASMIHDPHSEGTCVWLCCSDFSASLLDMTTLTVLLTTTYQCNGVSSAPYITNFMLSGELLLAGSEAGLLMARLPAEGTSRRKKLVKEKRRREKARRRASAEARTQTLGQGARQPQRQRQHGHVLLDSVAVADSSVVLEDGWMERGVVYEEHILGLPSTQQDACLDAWAVRGSQSAQPQSPSALQAQGQTAHSTTASSISEGSIASRNATSASAKTKASGSGSFTQRNTSQPYLNPDLNILQGVDLYRNMAIRDGTAAEDGCRVRGESGDAEESSDGGDGRQGAQNTVIEEVTSTSFLVFEGEEGTNINYFDIGKGQEIWCCSHQSPAVIVYDLSDNRKVVSWFVQANKVSSIRRGDSAMWIGTSDGSLHAWNIDTHTPRLKLTPFADEVRSIDCLGHLIVCGSSSGDSSIVAFQGDELLKRWGDAVIVRKAETHSSDGQSSSSSSSTDDNHNDGSSNSNSSSDSNSRDAGSRSASQAHDASLQPSQRTRLQSVRYDVDEYGFYRTIFGTTTEQRHRRDEGRNPNARLQVDKIAVPLYALQDTSRWDELVALARNNMPNFDTPSHDVEKMDKLLTENRDIFRRGIPTEHRALLWKFIILVKMYDGRKFKREGYFHRMLEYKEKKKSEFVYEKDVDVDLLRTFPSNIHFRKKTQPKVQAMSRVLKGFSFHNQNIGYCQGMGQIVGFLSLVLDEEEDVFWGLVYIVERLMTMGYYKKQLQLREAKIDAHIFLRMTRHFLPAIGDVFTTDCIGQFIRWFVPILISIVPAYITFNIWDSFLVEGRETLFRYALAILKMYEGRILNEESHPIIVLQNVSNIFDFEELNTIAFSFEGVQEYYDSVRAEVQQFVEEEESAYPML